MTDTVWTVISGGDNFNFIDITPDFDCPQMDYFIGNSNGKLVSGVGFSSTCWSIDYWISDKGVTVGAQCWANNFIDSHWSTMDWPKFRECL